MSNSVGLFGDSIMKGVVYDEVKKKYVYLDSSFANIFVQKTGFSVDNYAKFGCTLTKGNRIIEKLFSQLGKYKYIALEFGGNDCDFFWPAISEDPNGSHLPNTPIEVFERLYSQIIDRFIKNNYQPVFFSLPPLDPARYFQWLSKGLNESNIRRWLGDIDFIYRWQEMYSIAVTKIAAVKGVPLIDIRSEFLKSRNYRNLICDDGIHPNKAGHSLILETITKIMHLSKCVWQV